MHKNDADAHIRNESISIGEAARLLNLDRSTVFRKVQKGEISANEQTIGGRSYYSIELPDLEEYQRRREEKILNAPINQEPVRSPKAVA